MKKLIAAVIFLVVVTVFSCSSDDPAGSSTGDDSEYYPLSVGNVWVYGRSGSIAAGGVQIGTISGEIEVEITGTATHSEGFDVFIQEHSISDTTVIYSQTFITDSTFTEYMRTTDSGLFGYPHLTDTDSSFTVPFPLQEGATWTFSEEPPTTGEILSMSVVVAVMAGSFDECMEMRTVWNDSGMILTNTTDFAKNVGDVRNVFVLTADTMTTTVTNSLETYSLN